MRVMNDIARQPSLLFCWSFAIISLLLLVASGYPLTPHLWSLKLKNAKN
jgi:hypothetical protein